MGLPPESTAGYDINVYLHEFDLASSVFFGTGLGLGLALQILELFLQGLLPEQGLVALPLAPLQVLRLL